MKFFWKNIWWYEIFVVLLHCELLTRLSNYLKLFATMAVTYQVVACKNPTGAAGVEYACNRAVKRVPSSLMA